MSNERGFFIATRVAPGFTIRGDTAYLTGTLVGADKDFQFTGLLFIEPSIGKVSDPSDADGTKIENFPKGPVPHGWYLRKLADGEGFELVNTTTQEVLFGYRVIDNICHITTDIHDLDGPLAMTQGDDLIMSGGDLQFAKAIHP